MKKIACLVILAMFCVVIGAQSAAHAVPTLQIYIPGATYDSNTETWVIDSFRYELDVIGANQAIYDVKIAFAVPTNENGSILINWLTPSSAGYGASAGLSLTMTEGNGQEYSTYRNDYGSNPAEYAFGYGTPAMGDGRPLPPHDVFPTDFYEYFIGDFGLSEKVENYIPDDQSGPIAWGEARKFYVEVIGYSWVDIVAYDHVVQSKNKGRSQNRYVFSPFSHDGSSTTPVPEPATMLLVGSGMIGLAGLFRRKSRSRN